MMKNKNVWIASGLSLIPGLGHFYLQNPSKGAALLLIDAGVVIGYFAVRSRFFHILMILIYLLTLFQAVTEAYKIAKNGELPSSQLDSPIYVTVMLLVTGFSALPLLWQSKRFSQKGKVLWTIGVPVLAVVYFWALAVWGTAIDKFLWKI